MAAGLFTARAREAPPAHLLELALEQRLLHRAHRLHDVVVLAHDDLEREALHAEGLGILVELNGRRGHLLVELKQVLDLTEHAHQLGVEVDREQLGVLLAPQQRLLQLILQHRLLYKAS